MKARWGKGFVGGIGPMAICLKKKEKKNMEIFKGQKGKVGR